MGKVYRAENTKGKEEIVEKTSGKQLFAGTA